MEDGEISDDCPSSKYSPKRSHTKSPDAKRKLSSHYRTDRRTSERRPRSPSHYKDSRCPKTDSSSPEVRYTKPRSPDHRDKYSSNRRGSSSHPRSRSPKDPYYGSRSPNSSSYRRYGSELREQQKPKHICKSRSRSPQKSRDDGRLMKSSDETYKHRRNSPDNVPSSEEFDYVISHMKTEKDDTPTIFNKNFEDAIEKEFISEINSAIFYLSLHFQVIMETKFDKIVLDSEDKKQLMLNLQDTLKNRLKKLNLNRFMLETDIVALYKSIYKLKDDIELIQKLLDDVTYVEIIDDPADPPPAENVDSKMWFHIDQVLAGLNMNSMTDDDAQTVIIERIKEEHVLEEEGNLLPAIKIKSEPQDDIPENIPDIVIKTEPEDENEPSTEPEKNSEPNEPKPSQDETPVTNQTGPIIKTEPLGVDELQPYVYVDPIENIPKKKKKHIRKIFDYPDITKRPIPADPQFYITTKNVVKQMKGHIETVSEELELCLNAMDMVIVSELMKAKLRKKIKKLLKNKTYMRSPDITKLFREHHPKEVDKKFVKKVLKSFKKGPKPPKPGKVKIKKEKKDPETDEVKVVEEEKKPIVVDDEEISTAKIVEEKKPIMAEDEAAEVEEKKPIVDDDEMAAAIAAAAARLSQETYTE